MNILLSAKGTDVTTWRAVVNFTAAYRQNLIDLATSDAAGPEAVFSESSAAVEAAIASHQELLMRLNGALKDISQAKTADFKQLTVAYFVDLYRHFEKFRSAPVFYQMSTAFLKQLSATIIKLTIKQLALSPRDLPKLALIALGPAGRCEYSPFSPLQILLIHGEATEAQIQAISRFCTVIHSRFEEAGIVVDSTVTPRGARWRGTQAEWQARIDGTLYPLIDTIKLVDLGRLVDQFPLYQSEGFDPGLKEASRLALSENRPALADYVVRMTSLSNGLGFMGRLKLERSGSERGLYRLVDFGLLPLSSALSALALIKESPAVGTCERINELLRRRELDVELAERMLAAWYYLHELRLRCEESFRIDETTIRPQFLDPDSQDAEQQQLLKKHLESVAAIQLHVVITFSGMGV